MKILVEVSNIENIIEAAKIHSISGFTTNASLLTKGGVIEYEKFIKGSIEFLAENRPDTILSVPAFSDDIITMHKRAIVFNEWASDKEYKVYAKIPAVTTIGESTVGLYRNLTNEGMRCHLSGLMSDRQILEAVTAMNYYVDGLIGISTGNIADAGHDPELSMKVAVDAFKEYKGNNTKLEMLWDDTRESFGYIQAKRSNADAISMSRHLIDTMHTKFNANLENESMLYSRNEFLASSKAGYKIKVD